MVNRALPFLLLLSMTTLCLTRAAAQQPPSPTEAIDRLFAECRQLTTKGEFEDVTVKAQEALEQARKLGDKTRMARALNYIGLSYYHRDRVAEAIDPFKQAAELAREAGNHELEALALDSAGSILRATGWYEEAFYFYNQVLVLRHEMKDPREANVLNNLGFLFTGIGDYERASSLLQEGLRLARQVQNKGAETAALVFLGHLERSRERYEYAINYYNEALLLEPEGKNSAVMRFDVLEDLASAYSLSGNPQKALEFYTSALGLKRNQAYGVVETMVMSGIGTSLHELGRNSEALESLTGALARLRQLGSSPDEESHTEVSLADTLRSLGRNEEALASYRRAIAIIERLRSRSVPTESSRANIIASRRGLFVKTIDLLFALNRQSEGLEISEAYRARAFLDQLAEARVDLKQEMTREQREREDAVIGRIASTQGQLWNKDLAADKQKQLSQDLSAAENDLETFRLELRRTNPRYASVRYPAPLKRDRIQRELLAPDAALVEYVLGDDRSFAWVVSHNGLTAVVLPSRKQIEEQVGAYQQSLTEKVSALTLNQALDRLHARGASLYQSVFRPLEVALHGIRKLIIVPDGALSYLPFEALVTQARGKSSQQPSGFLIDRFAISYTPSASALASIKGRDHSAPSKALLAFGDPDYDNPSASRKETPSASSSPRVELNSLERGVTFNRLPHTRAEVTAISSLFPAASERVYLGAEAREQAIKAEKLSDYRFIHLAAHGYVNEERPARSGIVLSLANGEKDDGVLQMSEVLQLKLNADLVTLSACRTAVGKLIIGEGVVGLSRAFIYAGARSTVVSLWNVNDVATADLMKSFYQNLGRGIPKDDALRLAKLALLKSRQRTWQHPYFWAPFVLVGEPN
jgi:CHAT domain-containing protein/Flp pilus assembly protein TadD